MRRVCVAVFAIVVASVAAAAPPKVGPITLTRSGDDLVIAWVPVAPVDGYRVYRHDDTYCDTSALVYAGVAPTTTIPGVLADPTPVMYRVVAYDGSGESEPSPPIYKFSIVVPGEFLFFAPALVALPFHSPLLTAQDVCVDLNGGPGLRSPLSGVSEIHPTRATVSVKSCRNSVSFDIDPFAYLFHRAPDSSAFTPIIWGHAPEVWFHVFEEALDWTGLEGMGMARYEYPVTLPYDHDYRDLMEVACDIPTAVIVRVWDPDYLCATPPCPPWGIGLTRPSSSDPWTGVNVPLGDRRGHGLLIGVDVPMTWIPRTQCGNAMRPLPPDITSLRARRTADDVDMFWDPTESPAAGFVVYRVEDKRALSDLTAEPLHLHVGETMPTFPVVDVDARPPSVYYYQVDPSCPF